MVHVDVLQIDKGDAFFFVGRSVCCPWHGMLAHGCFAPFWLPYCSPGNKYPQDSFLCPLFVSSSFSSGFQNMIGHHLFEKTTVRLPLDNMWTGGYAFLQFQPASTPFPSTILRSLQWLIISFGIQFRALLFTCKYCHDLGPEGLPLLACSHKAMLLFPSKEYYQYSNCLRQYFLTCGSWSKNVLQSLWKWLLQCVHALFCFLFKGIPCK